MPSQKTKKAIQRAIKKKLTHLSPGLQRKIVYGNRKFRPNPLTPASNLFAHTMRHCNAGRAVDAALRLREHCDKGGKIFLTMSGAGSSFEQGVMIAEMIRAGKIAAISVTGANLEESLYRLVANSYYANFHNYEELTEREEKELDHAAYRRITDTSLPEEESVRILLPKLEKLWREAAKTGKYLMWHEYFFQLFERKLVKFDGKPEECWLYEAWRHKIPVFVGGIEDSTMGNIFAYYSYNGTHPLLSKYKQRKPIPKQVVLHSFDYMHRLAEWYVNNTKKKRGLAFVQLGGGIAADFPICVVPHLKKDFLAKLPIKVQEQLIRAWAMFIEVSESHMSLGSYTGAGGKEKITWSKLEPGAYRIVIWADYTLILPLFYTFVLRK